MLPLLANHLNEQVLHFYGPTENNCKEWHLITLLIYPVKNPNVLSQFEGVFIKMPHCPI